MSPRVPPSVEAFDRAERRLAERLRVLGPRWSTAATVRGAAVPPLVEAVRELLSDLARTAATLEGQPVRPLPEPAPHALGDMLDVLAGDVLDAVGDRPDEEVPGLLDPLTAALDRVRRLL